DPPDQTEIPRHPMAGQFERSRGHIVRDHSGPRRCRYVLGKDHAALDALRRARLIFEMTLRASHLCRTRSRARKLMPARRAEFRIIRILRIAFETSLHDYPLPDCTGANLRIRNANCPFCFLFFYKLLISSCATLRARGNTLK